MVLLLVLQVQHLSTSTFTQLQDLSTSLPLIRTGGGRSERKGGRLNSRRRRAFTHGGHRWMLGNRTVFGDVFGCSAVRGSVSPGGRAHLRAVRAAAAGSDPPAVDPPLDSDPGQGEQSAAAQRLHGLAAGRGDFPLAVPGERYHTIILYWSYQV